MLTNEIVRAKVRFQVNVQFRFCKLIVYQNVRFSSNNSALKGNRFQIHNIQNLTTGTLTSSLNLKMKLYSINKLVNVRTFELLRKKMIKM